MEWNLKEAISYYKNQGAPEDQNALVGLLREIQQENGGRIPLSAVSEAAKEYKIKESYLLALIKRMPSLRVADTHCLEVCAGPNCRKSAMIAACAEKLAAGGAFELKYTGCMRMCGKGPNVKWDGKLYSGVTEALLRELTR